MMNSAKMSISEIAYEKYRLEWMISHGYSLKDLIAEIEMMSDENPDHSISTLFDDWEYGFGFNSEIWCSYDEFCEAEYLDTDYMQALLTDSEFALYVAETVNN